MKQALLTLMVGFCVSAKLLAQAPLIRLASPGKKIEATVYIDNGSLLYRVSAGSLMLAEPAALGIKTNRRTVGKEVQALKLFRKQVIREQRTSRLNNSTALNHCIQYELLVVQQQATDTIVFRLFDNGCAFRYAIAGTTERVEKELTSFAIPASSKVWYFERNNNWKLKSYAGLWLHTTPDQLPTVSSQGPVQGKPLVMELPGHKIMAITEAALHHYSGMRLRAVGNNTMQVDFTEQDSGFAVPKQLYTPWRVILYASSLHELVNNKVIENLNPLPDPALFSNTAWIKPGIAVWSWITRRENYMDPAEEKRFVDAAAALNFQYSLIDEGWETLWPNKWKQLKELCTYAATKNIGIWVWKHSKDILDTLQRNCFLDSIRLCGAVGLKTDFMNSEEKTFIDFETGLLTAAAQRQLMVNFHGCQAPTGESVTWPNEMTREGIRGLELNIMNEPIPAWHNAALPFTRFICGHGDYTPAFFSNKANTTYTHQLALLYLFNSPFQCIAENPLTLLNDSLFQPILPLLRSLPVTWDETIVLEGSAVGQMAAFARRKNNTWYVAVTNGAESATTFRLTPSFLCKNAEATLIRDAHNGFISEKVVLKKKKSTTFTIPANGGLVLEIKD
jgi:Glycoside hydrolase 97.